jgi:hypothetical protein
MMVMTMTIFVDDTNWFYSDVGNIDASTDDELTPEYCTVLENGTYTVKLFHEAIGIGMSDRYYYRTVAEVFKGKENYTAKLADTLWIELPIHTQDDINKVLKWVYSNNA